jgi:hypothetical protein
MRQFSLENHQRFKTALSLISWNDVITNPDVNSSFDVFWNIFKDLFDLHFPYTSSKFNRNFHKLSPFMTAGLLISRSTKNSLYLKSVAHPSNTNTAAYKQYRNVYNVLIRKSRQLHYASSLHVSRKNPKKTWDILKEVTTGKTPRKQITEITSESGPITDPSVIAEEFNNFFSNIGSKIASSIPPSSTDPLSYIPNIPNVPQLNLNLTGPSQIIDLLKCFDNKSTPDLDGISIKLLKFVSHEIAVPLTHIFNLSITLGVFPDKFKTARIVPVYKAGDLTSCDNYRPIALVKSFSKILEKIVQINLVNHLEINKLLFTHQYGFLKNKSTEHNLLHVINHISESLNAGQYTIGVFLDLKKAFDVVDHDILLAKLSKYGIIGPAHDWFHSYLSNRSQIVDINNNHSQPKPVDMSVIQGSLLGPTLFLIFINDFPNCTSLSTFLFADDTSALKSGPNLTELFDFINIELRNIAAWYRANKMSANASKTKYIIFHNKGKHVNINGLELYFNDNEHNDINNPANIHILERIHNNNTNTASRSYKLLGIYLDENLTLNQHFSILSNKLSRALFFLRRVKNLLPPSALLTLYHSLFHCHLLYCPNILGTSSATNISKIAQLQRKAIRIITSSPHRAHTPPLFLSLNILPFPELLKLHRSLFMHSVEYRYCLDSFSNVWPKNTNRALSQQLRNTNEYTIPTVHRDVFKKFPLYSFPSTWNSLGPVKFQSNRTTFRISLTHDLFNSLFAEN